jgi:hypothetical protein
MNMLGIPIKIHRKVLTIATAAAVAAGLGGVALATTGAAGSTTISGCFNSSTGSLSVLTPKHKTCGKGEKSISWNQVGPQGEKGAKGAKGDPGPATSAFFTGGQFAASLGTPQTVASLSLPAGSFAYNVSVNLVNTTQDSDDVTCLLTDGGGKQVDSAGSTVPSAGAEAMAVQTIQLDGASTSAAGSATVSCQDTADSTGASVNGASFTATMVSAIPTAGAVLRTGSLTGPAVSAGDTLGITFNAPECTSGSAQATVSTNPLVPGSASLSITSLTLSGCQLAGLTVNITAVGLPWPMTIADTDGNTVTIGTASSRVNFQVVVPALNQTCDFSGDSLTGHWDNSINGITVPIQELLETGGSCPTFPVSGTLGHVKDKGALVFLS